MAAFNAGDRVGWSHQEATKHAGESVLRISALAALDPDALFGTIIETDESGRTVTVEFDEPFRQSPAFVGAKGTHADPACLALTADEIVRVAEE